MHFWVVKQKKRKSRNDLPSDKVSKKVTCPFKIMGTDNAATSLHIPVNVQVYFAFLQLFEEGSTSRCHVKDWSINESVIRICAIAFDEVITSCHLCQTLPCKITIRRICTTSIS